MGSGAEVVVGGLEVPEGPVVLPDGGIAFVEQRRGQLSLYADGRVRPIARAPGAWNSSTLGSDGMLYAPQNGGVVGDWRSPTPSTPAIQRISLDGEVETIATEVAGVPLRAPNDLVFGVDGRLYFTDPSEAYDPQQRSETNRLYALGRDGGEVLLELEPSYTNGLAFLADGRLCWVESYSRNVCVLEDGQRRVLATLPEGHIPDGLDVAEDGRLFVTTVTSHGITVVSSDGDVLDLIVLDDAALPTNCCFDGSVLWVTDFTAGFEGASDVGRLWRVETDAVGRPQTPAAL